MLDSLKFHKNLPIGIGAKRHLAKRIKVLKSSVFLLSNFMNKRKCNKYQLFYKTPPEMPKNVFFR